MNRYVSYIVIYLILTSCSGENKSTSADTSEIDWETMKIESDNQTIIIDKLKDFGVRDTCDFEEV